VARNETRLKEVGDELERDYGISVTLIPIDLSAADAAKQLHNRVQEKGLSIVLLCQIIRRFVIPAGERVSSAMDGKLKSIHGAWIPAQICLEQICIYPKGVRQESLT